MEISQITLPTSCVLICLLLFSALQNASPHVASTSMFILVLIERGTNGFHAGSLRGAELLRVVGEVFKWLALSGVTKKPTGVFRKEMVFTSRFESVSEQVTYQLRLPWDKKGKSTDSVFRKLNHKVKAQGFIYWPLNTMIVTFLHLKLLCGCLFKKMGKKTKREETKWHTQYTTWFFFIPLIFFEPRRSTFEHQRTTFL